MPSIKCSGCGFVNFEEYQFCQRCNMALSQDVTENERNETRLVKPHQTHIRPQIPQQNTPQNEYFPPMPPRRMPFPPKPNNALPQYQQPYRAKMAEPQEKPPPDDWSLPRFPKEQRPPQFQTKFQPRFQARPQPQIHYQQAPQAQYPQQNWAHYHQPRHQYYVTVTAFRRFGNEIILHKNSGMPSFCVRCEGAIPNSNDISFEPVSCRWHHPLVYLALFSPVIYLILSLVMTHRISVNVPLCAAHISQRYSIKQRLWASGLIIFLVTFMGCFFGWYLPSLLIAFIYLIVAAIVWEYDYKPLRVTKAEGDFVHLKGASNTYLNQIPY